MAGQGRPRLPVHCSSGRRTLMGIEGMGARVARKEDRRFITGAGRYVDDMWCPA